MPFRLLALGELSLYSPDSARKLAVPRKGLALLAVLASAGTRGVPREKVAALLWPDSEDSGRGALKQTIYELRQTLGNRSVVIGAADLALDSAEVTSDVGDLERAHAVEQWARVVELHAGPFLDRFHVRGSPEFDHWVDSHRARYSTLFRGALEKSARAAADAGDQDAATALWRRLAAEDPLNSRVALGLINALSEAGDSAGALAHYRVHERLLREELGAQPDHALIAAAETIRAGNGTLREKREGRTASVDHDAHRPGHVVAPDSTAPAPPPPSRGRVLRGVDRRVWLTAVLLLVIAGGVAAAWRERTPARVMTSLELPRNSSSRLSVDLHLNKIYVDGGASYDHALTVVDAESFESKRLPHGAGAAVDPLTRWIWSGDYGGRFVVIRNGRSGAEIGRVEVPGCPHHFAVDAQRAWVAQQCDDHITAIDNRTRMVVRHIPVPTLSREEVSGAKGMGDIYVNRATGIVYFWKDMIPHRLDPRTWEIRETPGVDGPVIGINEPTNHLYARMDNGLQVIDGRTDKVAAHVRLAGTPVRVAVGFGGRRVYLVTPQVLAALDGETHRVLWTMAFENGFVPDGIAADDGRGRLYVLGGHADGSRALKILRLRD